MSFETVGSLWEIEARKILGNKKIDPKEVRILFPSVLFPWDLKYNNERTYFSLRIQQRPLFIVRPETTKELERILNYVHEHSLIVRIMNGRHSTQLVSPEVLIDASAFLQFKIHKDTITVGAGWTQGAVNKILFDQTQFDQCCSASCKLSSNNLKSKVKRSESDEGSEAAELDEAEDNFAQGFLKVGHVYSHFGSFARGRVALPSVIGADGKPEPSEAFAGGTAATVGVAGISTVGGVGALKRTYGLTVDSIKHIVITVPPTKTRGAITLKTSEHENEDLFWALRGGGGNNFGIVSEIEYAILNVPAVWRYNVEFEWKNAALALHWWNNGTYDCKKRPSEFNEEMDLSCGHFPVTDPVTGEVKYLTHTIGLSGFYVPQSPQQEELAKDVITLQMKNLVEFAGGKLTITEGTYSDIYTKMVVGDTARVYYNYNIIQALFIKEFDPEAIVKHMEMHPITDGTMGISFELMGGAIRKYGPKDTAFVAREANFFMDMSANWNKVQHVARREAWLGGVLRSVRDKDPESIAYVGFPITFSHTEIPHCNKVYYGDNYPELLRLKGVYDPENVLTECGLIGPEKCKTVREAEADTAAAVVQNLLNSMTA